MSQINSNSKRIVGPRNQREITNQELAEYFAGKNIKKQKIAA